jgi:hypothetical protein
MPTDGPNPQPWFSWQPARCSGDSPAAAAWRSNMNNICDHLATSLSIDQYSQPIRWFTTYFSLWILTHGGTLEEAMLRWLRLSKSSWKLLRQGLFREGILWLTLSRPFFRRDEVKVDKKTSPQGPQALDPETCPSITVLPYACFPTNTSGALLVAMRTNYFSYVELRRGRYTTSLASSHKRGFIVVDFLERLKTGIVLPHCDFGGLTRRTLPTSDITTHQ